MALPKFALLYTSRRAQAITPVVELWLSTATKPELVEIALAIDADYAEGLTAAAEVAARYPQVKVVTNTGPKNCVAGWNTAGASAATRLPDIMLAIADDFHPPNQWDHLLTNVIPGPWWLEDRVVAVADGYNPDLFTLAIFSFKRYLRYGYVFYPGYDSLFSDTEFTHVAIADRVVIDARNLLFEHVHPDCNKRARDEVDLVHASMARWKKGEVLFNFRRETGFPLDAGPRAADLDGIYANICFAAYVQAIRDDFCLYEVIARLAEDAAGRLSAVYICVPDEYWNGRPQSTADCAEINAVAAKFRRHFPAIPLVVMAQPVALYRPGAPNRLEVETRVRNAAVNQIRKDGHKHIFILDGDELWKPGLCARLVDFIAERRPDSVHTGMTPVIGLPGYPIEGATDKATIYIGPDAHFTDCRGVSGHRHELPSYDVIHFTGTRRTKEEIAAKMRDSGHYDDDRYAFEIWLEHVLPNVRPGFRYKFSDTSMGLHMYRIYQVWPACRDWTADELASIPESLHQYLACTS